MTTIFDIAKTLARVDAALLRNDVPEGARQRILDEVTDAMIRDGLAFDGAPAKPPAEMAVIYGMRGGRAHG